MHQDESLKFHTFIGQRIRELRLRKGLSAAALAGKIGMQRSSISNIENARQKIFGETLWEIANALDCNSINELMPPFHNESQKEPGEITHNEYINKHLNRDQRDAMKWINSRSIHTGARRVRTRNQFLIPSTNSKKFEKMLEGIAKDIASDMVDKMKKATKDFEASLSQESKTNEFQNI